MEDSEKLQIILNAIECLHSSSSGDKDNYFKAQDTLLRVYDDPNVDRLALSVIRCGFVDNASSGGTLAVPDPNNIHELCLFYGLQMLQELLRRGQWSNLPQDRVLIVKKALLNVATEFSVQTSLAQNKLASVLASIALLDWPNEWQELFVTLQSSSSYHAIVVTLSVFRDVAEACWDISRVTASVPLKRKREVAKCLETGVSDIAVTLQHASEFLGVSVSTGLCSTSSDGPKSLVISQREMLNLATLAMDTLSCLCSSLPIACGLIKLRVDELAFFVLLHYPETQQTALNVIATLAGALGNRQRRGHCLAETLPEKDLERFASSIISLARVGCLCSSDRNAFLGQVTVALIVKDLVEKCGAFLIERLNTTTLETLWKLVIWPLIAHRSLTLSAHGISASYMFLGRFDKTFPPWISTPQFLCLLFVRLVRQGDPGLHSVMRSLETYWDTSGSDTSTNKWPAYLFLRRLADQFHLSKDLVPLWLDVKDTVVTLECSLDNDAEEEDANESDENQTQKLHLASSVFRQRFSTIKTTLTFAVTKIWSLGDTGKDDIFSFVDTVWNAFCSSPLLGNKPDLSPLTLLREKSAPSKVLSSFTAIPERFKPYLSSTFVLMDAVFSLIELLAHKLKLDPSFSRPTKEELWEPKARLFFQNVLSVQFPPSEMVHYLEIRRLDFVGTVVQLMTVAEVELSPILHFIFEKVFLGVALDEPANGNPTPLLINGTVENFADQAYLIRRRALYALISVCQRAPDAVGPFLEAIINRVRSRLCSTSIHETERSLLIESMVSAAAVSRSCRIQECFEADLTSVHREMAQSPQFTDLCTNVLSLLKCFFGKIEDWTSSATEVLDQLAENRRMVARFVGQVEGILRQAAIPREVEALESGGYWDGPEALGQTLQRSASSLFAPAKTLDQMLAKDDDCSAQFVFFLRHPMRQFVSTLLPVLFSFVTRYKLIWTNAEVRSSALHLQFLLGLGEEEWKALEGDVVTHRDAEKLRSTVENAFPIPSNVSSIDAVRLVRRHTFHIRTLLYRCLGTMSEVHSAFFGLPQIHTMLRRLAADDAQQLPIYHLPTTVELFWSPLFSKKNLAVLSTTTTVPVFGLLKYVFLPVLEFYKARILSEAAALRQEQESLSLTHDNSTLFLLRGYALRRTASALLEVASGLMHIKGSTTLQTGAASSLKDEAHREEGPSDDEEAGGGHHSSSGNVASSQPTSLSDHVQILKLEQAIFNDPDVLSGLLDFCVHLLQLPNATVITGSYLAIRLYAKQVTKNLVAIPSCAPKLIGGLFKACLSSALAAPILTDIASLAPTHAAISQERCSPLSDFVSGQDARNNLASVVSATLYECLRSLVRCYAARCSELKKNLEDPRHIMMLCPELYDALFALSKLPCPMSPSDLETFTTEVIAQKEKHNAKITKSALTEFITKNLKAVSSNRQIPQYSASTSGSLSAPKVYSNCRPKRGSMNSQDGAEKAAVFDGTPKHHVQAPQLEARPVDTKTLGLSMDRELLLQNTATGLDKVATQPEFLLSSADSDERARLNCSSCSTALEEDQLSEPRERMSTVASSEVLIPSAQNKSFGDDTKSLNTLENKNRQLKNQISSFALRAVDRSTELPGVAKKQHVDAKSALKCQQTKVKKHLQKEASSATNNVFLQEKRAAATTGTLLKPSRKKQGTADLQIQRQREVSGRTANGTKSTPQQREALRVVNQMKTPIKKSNKNDRKLQTPPTSSCETPNLPPKTITKFMQRVEGYLQHRKSHLDSLKNELYPEKTIARPEKAVLAHATSLYERGLKTYERRLQAAQSTSKCDRLITLANQNQKRCSRYAEKRRARTFDDLIAESERKAELLRRKTLLEQQEKQRAAKGPFFFDQTSHNAKKSVAANSLPKLKLISRDPNRLYNPEVIREKLNRQEALKHEIELYREKEALLECTFHPITNQKTRCVGQLSTHGRSIEGVQQYLQRAMLARRLEHDKQNREAQVFGRFCRLSIP